MRTVPSWGLTIPLGRLLQKHQGHKRQTSRKLLQFKVFVFVDFMQTGIHKSISGKLNSHTSSLYDTDRLNS